MNLRHLVRRHHHCITTPLRRLTHTSPTVNPNYNPNTPLISTQFNHTLPKSFRSSPPLSQSLSTAADVETDCDAPMNEFLSRFVHSMRSKLNEAYPNCDKHTIDSMLVVVVEKLVKEMEDSGGNFEGIGSKTGINESDNEDLTKTMWEVSNTVFREMETEKKKEKLKKYIQSEEVKELTQFAKNIGVRGDMLRELRFKWAREAMEDAEFYTDLMELKKQELEPEMDNAGDGEDNVVEGGERERELLPKRRGKINYKLYGLDLSGEKWREVADKIHEVEEVVWPSEAKSITGKCKLVTEKIVGLGIDRVEGEGEELIKEWVELLQPTRVDWVALLGNVKARCYSVYLKMAERVLDEPTFQPDKRDYSLLIDAHAKENRTEDVERLLKKMSEKGFPPDVLTLTALLHMYCRSIQIDKAKEAYEALERLGFKPGVQTYESMIIAYVNAGEPRLGEALLRKMELRDIKASEKIYISLLQAFANKGDVTGTQRIVTTMQFSGFQPTAESCTFLIQASAKSGDLTATKNNFEYMMKLGYKPNDRTISLLTSAYEKGNHLDKALSLLLRLEKDGLEPGILTYCVLVDWLGKLQLIDEAEQMLAKIGQLGQAPPLKLHVSLLDMYSRAGFEKKTLQALGVLEAKQDLLEHEDFERIIQSLFKGGFFNDADRVCNLMKAQGFSPSQSLQVHIMAMETYARSSTNKKPGVK